MASFRRAAACLVLLAAIGAGWPAAAQTGGVNPQEAARRAAEQKAREDALFQQKWQAINRSYEQGELFRQQQQQQQQLDQLQAQRQQLLNDQLELQNEQLRNGGYAVQPGAVYPPGYGQPAACQQYAQAYDAAGRPLGLVCVR